MWFSTHTRLLALIFIAATVLTGGCGGGSDPIASGQPPAGERAEDRIQAMLASDAAPSLAAEYEFFRGYYQLYPADPVGALGYSVTCPAYAMSVLGAKYGADLPVRSTPDLRRAAALIARGGAGAAAEALAAADGLLPSGGSRARRYPSAAMAADVKAILLPALRDSIAALGPLTQVSGVITTFIDEGVEYAVCSEEASAYRALLRLTLAGAATAVAYSWDAGTFDWDRTPAEMDANGDGLLTPAEYLPGPPFLTLTDSAALAEAWSALSGAVSDAGAAAAGMLETVDPRQLLARAGEEEPIPWAEVAQSLTALQLALLGPVMLPIPYVDPATGSMKQVATLVDLRAFWANPPADLRGLLPTLRYREVSAGTFDVTVDSLPDKTLGGLLPAGAGLPVEFWQALFEGGIIEL